MKLSRLFSLAALSAMLLIGAESRAALITLPTTFSVGDKTFTITAASDPALLTAILPLPGPPIGFQLDVNVTSGTDLALNYTASSSGPPITAVILSAVGTTGSSVAENIYSDAAETKLIASGSVLGGGSTTISLGGAYSTIYVAKDISGGTGAVSIVNQSFIQGVVPEPASMVLMGSGLVGVLGLGLRRMKKA
jgi:hypothetical protein